MLSQEDCPWHVVPPILADRFVPLGEEVAVAKIQALMNDRQVSDHV